MPTPQRPRWRAPVVIQHRAHELRRQLTPAERRLWQRLRGRQVCGQHFRKQHAVGPFIVDFFCAEAKLVVEIDGDSHAEQATYDAARTQWLNTQRDYCVMRFTNDEVHRNIEAVLGAIAAAIKGPALR